MLKWLTILFLMILAGASATSFFLLNEKINIGQQKLAEGHKQIEQGEKMLKVGKARLAAGKKQLSHGKKQYRQASAIPFSELGQILPKGKIVFDHLQQRVNEGGEKIAAGEKQVATGEKKVREGEARLKAGKLQLAQGKMQLAEAKRIRDACGYSAIFLMILSIMLVFCWRRPSKNMLPKS